MGKKLIIKGADFSENPVDVVTSGQLLPFLSMVSIVNNQAGYCMASVAYTNRLTILNNNFKPIKIPKGCSITLSGLKGTNGSQTALWVDYCMYNTPVQYSVRNASAVSANAPNLIATASNFVSSNYFPLNRTNGKTITVANTYGYDIWITFVAKAGSSGSNITLSNYSSGFTYTITQNS